MPLAFLIPVLSFVACPLIILFQRWLPLRGAPLAILAIAGGFVVWIIATLGFLNASAADPACDVSGVTGALTCHFSTAWFEAGVTSEIVTDAIHLNWGILIDPLTVVLLGLITFVRAGCPALLTGIHEGRPSFRLVFCVAGAVRRRHADAGAGRQLPAALHRLGVGGPVFLPAHRVLV